jgi:hypothetical protein
MTSRHVDGLERLERGRFLTVTGVVDDEGNLAVEPGFQIEYRRRIPRPVFDESQLADALILSFLDEGRTVLTQATLMLTPLCLMGGGGPRLRSFADAISCPEKYAGIRYHVGQRMICEVLRPQQPPSVRFTKTPNCKAEDSEVIEWQVEWCAEAEVRSIVLYSHDNGATWDPIVPPSANTQNCVSIRFAGLPGGRARLRALVTDGFTTTSVDCEPFDVPVKGVRPSILGPLSGAVVPAASPTWFHGQAYDYEQQDAADVEMQWRSSRDGLLGCGTVISAMLSPGHHDITLSTCGCEVSVRIHAQEDLPKPPDEGDFVSSKGS